MRGEDEMVEVGKWRDTKRRTTLKSKWMKREEKFLTREYVELSLCLWPT